MLSTARHNNRHCIRPQQHTPPGLQLRPANGQRPTCVRDSKLGQSWSGPVWVEREQGSGELCAVQTIQEMNVYIRRGDMLIDLQDVRMHPWCSLTRNAPRAVHLETPYAVHIAI